MVKEIIKNLDDKMKKTISVLKKELTSMKAGKANPSMLDRIQLEYYGAQTPLNQLANISTPEPRVLLIQPWDKASIGAIEKAILVSDLGLNPSNDGNVIRLLIPELTEETRKDLCKKIKKTGEETKVALRSIRREANEKIKALKKDNDITEDEMQKSEKDVQKFTDEFVKEVDKLVSDKEKEVMAV